MRSGQLRVKGQQAVYQETLVGWIIAGRISKNHLSKFTPKFTPPIACNVIKLQELPILWELESDSNSKVRSNEELACEDHFQKYVKRMKSGRYCVNLPFNEKRGSLSNSKNTAFQRFYAGKCTRQPIGRHKIGKVPQIIASYLQLSDAKRYPGHCF